MNGDAPSELTDEMTSEMWLKIVDETEALIEQIQNPTSFTVEPSSILGGDDSASNPYRVSHCARQALTAGVDHMHALKSLIRDEPPGCCMPHRISP